MRIGIYNRYWDTRGGGERYAGVMAEVLSRDHAVELLGPDEIGLRSLSGHLGLDLSHTTFREIPGRRERDLAPLTAGYDLFVNCTYLSRLASRARRSVYVVLFPQKAWPRPVVRAARRILDPFVSDEPDPVVPVEGFHPPDPDGARWSRNAARLRVDPWAFRRGRARIRLATPESRSLEDLLLEVRGTGFDWRVHDDQLVLQRTDPSATDSVDLEIRCRTFVPAELGLSGDRRRLGVCLVDQRAFGPKTRRRKVAERVRGRLDARDPGIPAGYDLLLSISEYTRRWISKRWGLPSEVLAPPVDTEKFEAPEPGGKERLILSVGRFFHGSHNKKHLEMLRVFRRMVDRGEIPEGWEYHLAGNLHRNHLADLEYFAELGRLAEGYPVKLLVDLEFDRLLEEYRRASIFWHAAGWGESERRRPEKFEHFGLTTCEAMSSGCIPVVIAKAGQLEIVDHGENGFLFSSADELAGITRRLIRGHGEPWVHETMERARAAVQRYSHQRFEERLRELFDEHDILSRRLRARQE